ncbi:hypothetical protein IGI04_014332 [Brassica rapa subsp. trilocularis]|uniref:Uncharacterized protein n=1 Tax=Brassica rapa subsp. trilocularis TaxID=1813537 RepID=A0ABQ7MMM3_BRACM|nr:hypothetical protein IGI04_014332 [Brassica rapa subsp. trilocularis]
MEMDLAKPPDRSGSPAKIGVLQEEVTVIEELGKGSGKAGEVESRVPKKSSWVEVVQERKEKAKELAQLAIEEQKESEKNAGDNSTQEVEVRKLDMQNQNGEVEEIEEGQIEEQWLQISPGKSSSGRLKETTFEQVRTASRFSVLSDLEETEKPENQNEDVVEKVMEGTELRNEENEIEGRERRELCSETVYSEKFEDKSQDHIYG